MAKGEGSVMTKTNLGGQEIKLIRSDVLPSRTMVVSPDLYDMLANDGEAAKKAHAETLSKMKAFSEMVRKVKP
jgi:hypothetical protein